MEIKINEESKRPKYLQIVDAVVDSISNGKLEANEQLPSVNNLLKRYDVSRDTIVKAYDRLKRMQIVDSVPGKGYYVLDFNLVKKKKVLLIFNKLSQHKKIIYDAFVSELGQDISVDFYIYNNDFRSFKSLVEPRLSENYAAYVVIGHFLKQGLNAVDIINEIPKEKLVIVDKDIKGINGSYSCVYQDFESDILQALREAKDRISKYNKMKLIFPSYTYQPKEIVSGFIKYCNEIKISYDIVKDLDNYSLERNTAYVVTMEDDLVTLIKKMKGQDLEAGKDVGIISYNETPLKEILLDGITTISTDFNQLGSTAARMVKEGKKERVKNPFYIKFRKSL